MKPGDIVLIGTSTYHPCERVIGTVLRLHNGGKSITVEVDSDETGAIYGRATFQVDESVKVIGHEHKNMQRIGGQWYEEDHENR